MFSRKGAKPLSREAGLKMGSPSKQNRRVALATLRLCEKPKKSVRSLGDSASLRETKKRRIALPT